MKGRRISAATRYIVLAVITSLTTWLDNIGAKDITDVTWIEWAGMTLGAATAALVAWGALLNQSFHVGKDATK